MRNLGNDELVAVSGGETTTTTDGRGNTTTTTDLPGGGKQVNTSFANGTSIITIYNAAGGIVSQQTCTPRQTDTGIGGGATGGWGGIKDSGSGNDCKNTTPGWLDKARLQAG